MVYNLHNKLSYNQFECVNTKQTNQTLSLDNQFECMNTKQTSETLILDNQFECVNTKQTNI